MPSFIWIRQTVWPQYTNVTDRTGQKGQTDRQTDNGPIAYCEPFYKRSPNKTYVMYQYLQIYYSAISTWTQALRELHLDVWEPANRVWEPGTSVWEPESRVWELASRVWELKRDVWELSSHQLPLNLTPG